MPVVLASFAAVSLDMTCKGDVFLGLLIELAVRRCGDDDVSHGDGSLDLFAELALGLFKCVDDCLCSFVGLVVCRGGGEDGLSHGDVSLRLFSELAVGCGGTGLVSGFPMPILKS